MKQHHDNGAMIRSYLLGELVEEQRRHFEERLMTDEESYEELLAVEDELLDQYVGGALSGPERERFERHFLSTPERRRKLSFAKTLKKYVAAHALEEQEPETGGVSLRPVAGKGFLPSLFRARNPLVGYAFAAVLALTLFGGAWLVLNRWREPSRGGGAVVAFTLRPGAVRDAGDGLQKILVPAEAGTAELRLALATDESRSYRARIFKLDEERLVFETDASSPQTTAAGSVVVIRAPAKSLTPGDYEVKLAGTVGEESEAVGSYYFRVTRK